MWTIICFVIVAVSVAVDQVTKVIAVKHLADVDCVEVIPGVLEFKYVENDGMAFGLLSDARWVFMTVSVIAICALIFYLVKWRPQSKVASIGLSLIIGGGIGNMIDRFFFTGILPGNHSEKVVRDFIYFCGFGNLWIWVFNIADACVCVGGAMLLLWCVYSIIKEAKAEKAKKAKKALEADGPSEQAASETAEPNAEEIPETQGEEVPEEKEENKN